MKNATETVLILDFGSQFAQLIAVTLLGGVVVSRYRLKE